MRMLALASKIFDRKAQLFLNMNVDSKVLCTAPPVKSPAINKGDRLIWFDLEMTGLDPAVHHIMEAACLVTDGDLHPIGDGVNVIINQPDEVLNKMNDWCKEHHGQSGLTENCRNSSVSVAQAEKLLLSYMEEHTDKGICALAGNTVYMDRFFLMKYMPKVHNHMHYRIVDVSSVKELCRRFAPKTFEGVPKKVFAHRALEDIKESIEELKYYKSCFFKHK